MKDVKIEEISLIKQQKELQEKRAALLNKKGLLLEKPDDEDEEKRLKRKNKIIEDLKVLRQKMKAVNLSNPYGWLHKYTNKLKPGVESEPGDVTEDKERHQSKVSKRSDQSKVLSFLEEGEEGESEGEEEVEEEETEEYRMSKFFQVTAEEVEEAIENFDILEELGTFYGKKVLSKVSEGPLGKVRLERKTPPQASVNPYMMTCEPEGFSKKV